VAGIAPGSPFGHVTVFYHHSRCNKEASSGFTATVDRAPLTWHFLLVTMQYSHSDHARRPSLRSGGRPTRRKTGTPAAALPDAAQSRLRLRLRANYAGMTRLAAVLDVQSSFICRSGQAAKHLPGRREMRGCDYVEY